MHPLPPAPLITQAYMHRALAAYYFHSYSHLILIFKYTSVYSSYFKYVEKVKYTSSPRDNYVYVMQSFYNKCFFMVICGLIWFIEN